MPVKVTTIATALTLLALLGLDGFAQDLGNGVLEPGTPGTAGHTFDELGHRVKTEARRVKQTLGEARQVVQEETALVRNRVTHRFESVKAEVWQMPAHHRVYARIHWDKSLHGAQIEVHMLPDGAVVLRGTVPTEAARSRALELARECVGVPLVIDELTLPTPALSAKTAIAPKPTAVR
jgi:hypothetical protein